MILDVALEVHRAVKTGADDLSDVGAGQQAPHAPLNPTVRRQTLQCVAKPYGAPPNPMVRRQTLRCGASVPARSDLGFRPDSDRATARAGQACSRTGIEGAYASRVLEPGPLAWGRWGNPEA